MIWRSLIIAILWLGCIGTAQARDAAFVEPGGGGSLSTSGDAITVEPKNEIDVGETTVNIAKRVTLFFVNQSTLPIDVVSMTVSGDGNVTPTIISDDCSKENKMAPSSRCSVVVSIVANSGGNWSAEVLLTHKGAGRIAKVKISGKATGAVAQVERKDAGLSLSSKEIPPINFGDIEAGNSKLVRTALMVNDSPESITLQSIDLIAAENGLERMEQGCAVDLELKGGESCPITLMWKPQTKGIISTDLIIRHTGHAGFVVIQVRGVAHESPESIAAAKEAATHIAATHISDKTLPTATELEKIAGVKVPQVAASALGAPAGASSQAPAVGASPNSASKETAEEKVAPAEDIVVGSFHLIGTVGSRAVLLKPEGITVIAGIGEDIRYGKNKIAKLTNIAAKTAEIFIDGQKQTLNLEVVADLTDKATSHTHDGTKSGDSSGGGASANKGLSTGVVQNGGNRPAASSPSNGALR